MAARGAGHTLFCRGFTRPFLPLIVPASLQRGVNSVKIWRYHPKSSISDGFAGLVGGSMAKFRSLVQNRRGFLTRIRGLAGRRETAAGERYPAR